MTLNVPKVLSFPVRVKQCVSGVLDEGLRDWTGSWVVKGRGRESKGGMPWGWSVPLRKIKIRRTGN